MGQELAGRGEGGAGQRLSAALWRPVRFYLELRENGCVYPGVHQSPWAPTKSQRWTGPSVPRTAHPCSPRGSRGALTSPPVTDWALSIPPLQTPARRCACALALLCLVLLLLFPEGTLGDGLRVENTPRHRVARWLNLGPLNKYVEKILNTRWANEGREGRREQRKGTGGRCCGCPLGASARRERCRNVFSSSKKSKTPKKTVDTTKYPPSNSTKSQLPNAVTPRPSAASQSPR